MKELVISAHGFNSLSSFLSCEYGETEQLPVAALLCLVVLLVAFDSVLKQSFLNL